MKIERGKLFKKVNRSGLPEWREEREGEGGREIKCQNPNVHWVM